VIERGPCASTRVIYETVCGMFLVYICLVAFCCYLFVCVLLVGD
jgi:hypothetical protein